MNKMTRTFFVAFLLAWAGSAVAAGQDRPEASTPAVQLRAWDQLTPAQRELLVAPVRERWDANPSERARILRHAQRWQTMTPEQRTRARRGLRHWEHMDPARRVEMRALFEKMKKMSPEQRKALRDKWHAMTAEQRRAWVEANPPRDDAAMPR
jgi:hypothetical protein